VLIVLNEGQTSQTFDISWHGQRCRSTLKEKAVGTYVW
jgi:hypothetical protein